jgi:hypothetical protein
VKPRQTTAQHPDINNLIAIQRQHARVMGGNISFGNGTNGNTEQNINGVWATGTTPATPNTPFTLNHVLGKVPIGFDVKRINKAGSIFDSGTAWTNTQIFVESNVASATFSLFIF